MYLDTKTSQSDLLVMGSGVAGLSAALAAAEAGATVLLLTAGALLSGSSPWAQGGIAAALGDDDPLLHAADTTAVGGSLNDSRAVAVLVTEGQRAVRELLAVGVPFDGGPLHPDLGLEAGHHRRRIVHANEAATGRAVTSALLARALAQPRITPMANAPAEQLLSDRLRVHGVESGGVHRPGPGGGAGHRRVCLAVRTHHQHPR